MFIYICYMFIYRCHVFPPQGLGCYASSVSHSFSNLWFREILVSYFMGKWQAAKQPSLRCCWCRWSDGWRPSVLHWFTFSRQEMSRVKTSDKKMLWGRLIIVDSHLTNVKDLVWATGCINLIAYIVCQWLLTSPKQDKQEAGMQTCMPKPLRHFSGSVMSCPLEISLIGEVWQHSHKPP